MAKAQQLYDAAGNPVPGSFRFMGDDPFEMGLLGPTPGDIQREQRAGAKEALVAGGIGLLGSAAQLGLTAIPTEQDRFNKKRLGQLEEMESRNELGLTGGERQEMETALLAPVRALATENRQRTEATLAARGGTSAADLARVRRESERRTNEAAMEAGGRIAQTNLARAEEQRAEMEERRSYQSSRARQRVEMLGQTIAGLAQEAGPVLAASATARAPSDAQLLAMQKATYADGGIVYPGLRGKTLDEMRLLYTTHAKQGRKPDGAVLFGAHVPGGE